MNKIVVPLDFSDRSIFAVKLAAHIQRFHGSEIHLLHMVDLPTGVVDMGAGSNFSIPESMMYLRKLKERIETVKMDYFEDPKTIKHAIQFQNPFEGINAYTQKVGASLLIMGATGLSEFEEIVIGSTTEKIVRTSEVPVIVVKRDLENFSLDSIVFASNFKESAKQAFEKLVRFAEPFNSTIHLVRINTAQKFETTHDSLERMTHFLEGTSGVKTTISIYNDTSIATGVVHFAASVNADLIAFGTHGRSGLSNLFNTSNTKSISKSVMRPLITFKI